jgi:hypothetical protein
MLKNSKISAILVIALIFFFPSIVLSTHSTTKPIQITGYIQQPINIQNQNVSIPNYFLGLSGYPTSTRQIDKILQIMNENHLNIYRMSFNPEWFSSKPHPYRTDLIQYFLDNCNFTLIIDRNHLYPPTEESALAAQENWQVVEDSIFEILEQWPNNPRVIVELINEYIFDDFYPKMQELVTKIRNQEYTNPILFNKWNQPWTKINDPINQTYQGYHFYFNSWSLQGAMNQIQIAHSKGIQLINTEIGADYREHDYFNQETVQELNNFILQCKELNVGNTIWMNENLDNWPDYQENGLSLP